jgi:preprotein translocase subunit SecG
MITFLTILTALVCLLLMGAVLIQNPKGGGLDASFGGAGNQMFGAAKSTDFIEKATWGLAAALFLLCIITSLMVKYGV